LKRLAHVLVLTLMPASSLFAQGGGVDNTPITPGGIYNLVSKTSGMVLDNSGYTTYSTGIVQTSTVTGNTNQQWELIYLSNGSYQIICLTSGMALDNQGSTANDSPVVQNIPSSASANQQWRFNSLGNGYYQIVSVSSGLALDNQGSTSSGTTILQATVAGSDSNQQWSLTSITIGATTPFTTYEAEAATLGGGATAVALTSFPTTQYVSNPQLEASGHAYVNLSATGQSVTFTNTTGKSITAINVRYNIPDAPTGGGISSTLDVYVNGAFRQALAVSSAQMYEYVSSNGTASKIPSSGLPHVFWDETHTLLTGAAVPPGGTITLQMDAANTASFYNIDLLDMEAPPGPLTQPANSLSLTADCGGEANNSSFDNSTALQNCFNNAASQGKSVWIPQGTFYLNTVTGGWNATGITIQGAGMWYSTIYYNPPLPVSSTGTILNPNSSTLKNFAINENAIGRITGDGYSFAINMSGSNWLIDSVWIEHGGPSVWASGTFGTVENSRIDSSWSDGINLNGGNGAEGNNLTAVNNFIRGTGDDGMAINSVSVPPLMYSITLVNNTVVAPWGANNTGIYGGTNDLVANNLFSDSVSDYGILIGIFSTTGAPVLSANVQGNTCNRCGDFGEAVEHPAITFGVHTTASGTANVMVSGNTINNAAFDAMDIQLVSAALISNNTINAPGNGAFVIESNPGAGNATFICNTVTNLKSGYQAYVNNKSAFTATGFCNNGFTVPSSLTTPTVVLSLSPSSTVSATQTLTVTITVSGPAGSPTPTGSVTLIGGDGNGESYSSGALTLANGSVSISIPPGTLGSGADELIATYTPDTAGSATYVTAFGTASISVAIPPVVPVSFAFSVYHNLAGMYDGSTVTDYPRFLTTDGGGNVWFSMNANPYVNAISNSGAALSPAGATANTTAGFAGSVCANCTFQGATQTYQRPNSLSISRPAVDQSGNVWVPISGVGSTYVDLLVGIATPKVNPDSLGLKNGTFGSQP
jgi:Ricin-type beta-trefoil lectin domain-like